MAEGLVLTEQRSLARRELIYYLKIVDRLTRRELGRMGDIHSEGLLLFGDKPLKIGSVHDVAMELPKTLREQGGKKELDFRIEAVWSRPGPKNSTYHETGAKFVDIDAARRAAIARLIELFAMPGS